TAGFGPAAFAVGGFAVSSARFLNEKSVQDELKLSDEQRRRIPASVRAQIEADLLTPGQLQRYRGIYIQQLMTAYGPAGAFRIREVVEPLNLSDEQKQQISTIGSDDAAALRDLGNAPDPQKVRDLDAATRSKLEKVLTAEQKTRLRDVIGPRFEGHLNT